MVRLIGVTISHNLPNGISVQISQGHYCPLVGLNRKRQRIKHFFGVTKRIENNIMNHLKVLIQNLNTVHNYPLSFPSGLLFSPAIRAV